MKPNLLMRSWMMAHVYGAEYQAAVCHVGSDGDVAFRESLCPQYTSKRHDAKGIRTYHITGTFDGTRISRVACGRLGSRVAGADEGLFHITITSNTDSWQEGELVDNEQLVSLHFDMQRTVKLARDFLSGCPNLERVALSAMRAIDVLPECFLNGCSSLKVVDLSPFANLKEVEVYFLKDCVNLTSIDLTPLRAVEELPEGFLCGCSSLTEVDLSPLVNLREIGGYFLIGCSSIESIDLAPLRAVEVLGYGFLGGCSSLEVVDLSPLVHVVGESVEGCLEGCTSLKTIRLGHHQPASVIPEALRGLIIEEMREV